MYPTDLSTRFSEVVPAFRNNILTRVGVLNIKIETVDDRRNSLALSSWERIEGTRKTSPRIGERTVGTPQEIRKGLSIHCAGEIIFWGCATKG